MKGFQVGLDNKYFDFTLFNFAWRVYNLYCHIFSEIEISQYQE